MEDSAAMQEDLHYLKGVVSQRRRGEGAPAIYLIWGVLTLVGYPILDWRPEYEGLYWAVAGPLGGIASWLIARSAYRRLGEGHSVVNRTWIYHWLIVTAAMGMLFMLVARGALLPAGIGPAILLLVTLSMALGALYAVPRLGWNALILALGYGLLFVVEKYAWTIIGVCFFVCSLVNYLLARRARG